MQQMTGTEHWQPLDVYAGWRLSDRDAAFYELHRASHSTARRNHRKSMKITNECHIHVHKYGHQIPKSTDQKHHYHLHFNNAIFQANLAHSDPSLVSSSVHEKNLFGNATDIYRLNNGAFSARCLQCFDAVGWAARRASGL